MEEGVTAGRRRVRICMLGGEQVGKTTLAMRLVGMDPQPMPASRQPIVRNLTDRRLYLEYHLLPAIGIELAERLTQGPMFDMFICLFKDSTSFGQLYEFLEGISSKSEEQGGRWRDYWLGVKNIVLVYYEFAEQGQVQIEELFNILSEEIRNFNRSGAIKQFVLKKEMTNHQYLKELIEKTKFEEQMEDEYVVEDTERADVRVGQDREAEENLEEDVEDMPEMVEIKLTSTKPRGSVGSQEEVQVEQEEIPFPKENKVEEVEMMEVKENPLTTEEKHEIVIQEHQQIAVEQRQAHQLIIEQPQQKKDTTDHIINPQPAIPTTAQSQPQLQLQKSSQDKETEHYQQVYRRLMEKINSEEIEASKKTSYKNIFEQFRRTSKEESKISKELLEYWQEKIEKLEEENEVDDDEQQGQPPQQIQQEQEEENLQPVVQLHPRSAQDRPAKHGEPLKPHSNYLDSQKPRRQKSAVDTKPCLCEVM